MVLRISKVLMLELGFIDWFTTEVGCEMYRYADAWLNDQRRLLFFFSAKYFREVVAQAHGISCCHDCCHFLYYYYVQYIGTNVSGWTGVKSRPPHSFYIKPILCAWRWELDFMKKDIFWLWYTCSCTGSIALSYACVGDSLQFYNLWKDLTLSNSIQFLRWMVTIRKK